MQRNKILVDSFTSHLSSLGLGLKRKTVRLDPHNPLWSEAFQWVFIKIKNTLAGLPCEVHHGGSTSIPGLSAKPILDLLLVFPSTEEQKKAIPLLGKIGFVFKGDIIGKMDGEKVDSERHFYSYYDDKMEVDYIHLHSFTKNHKHLLQMIEFRDLLKKDEKALMAYEKLKQDFYSSGKTRRDYTISKKDFVQEVLKKT